jgi:23S rRNA pseudouridine2457 synthase
MLLTNDGVLQQKISSPQFKLNKIYLVQLDGDISESALQELNRGVMLKDGQATAINARRVNPPLYLWPRTPPVRFRKNIPTSWIELGLREGRNRQVRRMTAAVGFPTLRLVRTSIGSIVVWPLAPGASSFAAATALYGDQ